MPVLIVIGLVIVIVCLTRPNKDEDNKDKILINLSGATSPVSSNNELRIPTNRVGEIPQAAPRDGSQLTASWVNGTREPPSAKSQTTRLEYIQTAPDRIR